MRFERIDPRCRDYFTFSISEPSSRVGQRAYHDVLELHVARMALQADVAFTPACGVRWDGIVCDELPIERYLYEAAGGLNFKCIPLTGRFGCDRRGRRQGIHGTGLV